MKTLSFHDWSCGRTQKALIKLIPSWEVASGLHLIVAPNGYGKSTFLQTLGGALKPLSGEVRLNDQTLDVERDVLYLSEYLTFPKFVYPLEWVEFVRGEPLNEQDKGILKKWITGFGLDLLLNRPLGKLSQGERRKITWLSAQMSHKPVLLLDEPLDGLDLLAIKTARELLIHWSQVEKRIVFLVAHQIAEVLDLVNQIWLWKDQTWIDASSIVSRDLKGNFYQFRERLLEYYVKTKPQGVV